MNSIDELMQWLQNWIYSNYKKSPLDITHVTVRTIDNPGWGVTIDLVSLLPDKNLPLADVSNSESDWYYCTIKDNKFEGDGGLFNLEDIFCTFKQFVDYENNTQYAGKSQKMRINDDLTWLLQWFANQCDGDWEHEYGVRIGTLDNPGWRLRVSLLGTELESREFERIAIERSENDWLFCFIEEGHFEGACGLCNLPDVLKIFRNWAES